MALDFPSSPTNGQVYNNWTYNSTKGVWQASPLDQQQASVSATAPLNPAQGDMWFNTDDGNLYVYYNDGDTSQWVQTRSDVSLSSTIGPSVDSLLARSPNFLINGGMDIWQRGTSSTTSGTYAADRWLHSWPAGTATVSQSTDVPSGIGFRYSLSFASTNGTTPNLVQRIESLNAVQLAGKTVTFSIWAKSSVGTGALAWATAYPPSTDTWTSETIDATGTFVATMTTGVWTRYSATFTVNALATRGYRVQVYRNVTTTSTTTLYAGAQLEFGSQTGNFRRHGSGIQGELAACQRYYFRKYPDNVYGIFGMGFVHGGAWFITPIQLPVPMRAIPSTTLDWTGTAANYRTMPGGSANALTSSPYIENGSAYSPSASMVGVTAPITATTSGLGGVLQANNTTSAYLGFSAEL